MIDSEEKLAVFLPRLRKANWVALDTEADSLHAYPEKVCLIQISTASGDRLIDPLARLNLDRFLDALSGHQLIMHGADYDLRLLRKHHEFVPNSIFDTMLAARLLGHRQFGLSHLVTHYLGVKLDKGSQKANWGLRPLTERMERYARNDTHYLKPLSDQLSKELNQKGRLAWHQESCARLVKDSTQPTEVDANTVWRVKGSHLLNRHALAVLRELWHWRETEAVAANRPPFFVLPHETLVKVAAAAVARHSVENLLPDRLSDRRRSGLKQAITRGLALPASHYPLLLVHSTERPSEVEKKKMRELQLRRDARAAKLGIDPTLIASRVRLMDLARNRSRSEANLMNWQRSLLVM